MDATTSPVFTTIELLEEILLHTTPRTILTCLRVDWTFNTTIQESRLLQRKLFLHHDQNSGEYQEHHKRLLGSAYSRSIVPWRHNLNAGQLLRDTIELNPLVIAYLWPLAAPVRPTCNRPLSLIYQVDDHEFRQLEGTSALKMYLTDRPCTIDVKISRISTKACGGDVLVTLGHCRLGEIVNLCKAIRSCFARCSEDMIDDAKTRKAFHAVLDQETGDFLQKHDGKIVRFY